MCGLFGLVRAEHADPDRATRLLLGLGLWAEERGIDGAGLALGLPGRACPVRLDAANRRDVRVGRWRVVKGPGRFGELTWPRLDADLEQASLVLGHTRWATQGVAGRLVNTSPLVVQTLIGTHNGDIDAAALREHFGVGAAVGTTDTAVLLAALDGADHDPHALTEVLSAVVGRAALAWSSVLGPQQLWLARGGLSPLAVARDDQDNLFWASNPQWLRVEAAAVGVRLRKPPVMIAPGLLMRVVTRDGIPELDGWWRFKPTVRVSDVRLTGAVWRGFTAADRSSDRQRLRHRVYRPARSAGALPAAGRGEQGGHLGLVG